MKNVKEPYIGQFSAKILSIYQSMFPLVDGSVRKNMKRLLGTWTNIFPPDALEALKAYIARFESEPVGATAGAVASGGITVTKGFVLQQIQQAFPLMAHDAVKLAALQQLYNIIQTQSMTPLDYQNISNQISTMMTPSVAPTQFIPSLAPVPAARPPAIDPSVLAALAALTSIVGVTGTTARAPQIAPSKPSPPPSVSKFYEPPPPAPVKSAPSNGTSSNTKKLHADAVASVYDDLELQCSQCGFRYFGTDEGKSKMKQHLDWHFRLNKQSSVRQSMSRDWFLSAEEWITSGNKQTTAEFKPSFDDDENGDAKSNGMDTTSDGGANGINDETHFHDVYVVADGDGFCQICMEKFDRYWHDGEEEWVFRAATKREDGSYVHQNCLRESKGEPASILGKRSKPDE